MNSDQIAAGPRAETFMPTPNASRYLQQLCRHWAHRLDVAFTPSHGDIQFGPGRACTLDADEAGLSILIAAPDSAEAARLGDVVIAHLQRFAFREDLPAPTWLEAPPRTEVTRID